MADRGAGRARFTILSLLGSQLDVLGEQIWLPTLLALLRSLGLTESAARAQLQRMAAAGWFEVERHGRRSRYGLTELARSELRSGDRRVLERSAPPWDGRWTIVAYELDEGRRTARDRLRANLQWLGFGPLGAGVWISPHRLGPAVLAVRERLALTEAVHVAEDAVFGGGAPAALVPRCWDLEEIASRWRALDERRRRHGRLPTDGERAFVQDFELLSGLLGVLRVDPNLPAALLPPRWAGTEVRRACEAERARLRPLVQAHVEAVVRATAP
ncbi:MAG: hypothetical protein IT196_03150 [Acidimicrobiales bacterium]|nr:hypothetical protein [Acidimicrobiales bacterium]